MSGELTRGAIEEIMNGNTIDKPILQVLGHKMIAGNTGSDRYRLLLSDGKFSQSSAMLATQLNDLVTSKQLETFTVIRLDKYITNTIQPGRRVMILLEVQVLTSGDQVGQKLGSPQPWKAGASGGDQAPAADHQCAPAPAEKPPMNRAPLANQMSHANVPQRAAFGGNKPPGQSQGAPNTPGGTRQKVHPISSLTPYQNRWCVRARVTTKSSIRTWSNSRGEGKLFNMTLLDESGEIRATVFTSEVDKFNDLIEVNKVYYISKAQLKTADKRYSSLNNDYEMNFGRETEVIPCTEDTDLPNLSFNFIPINELEKHEAGSTVDVIGVVKSTNDLSTIISKNTQKEIKKRDLQIVDESRVLVRATIWGTDAENFDGSTNPVMAIKGCRLSDWGGRSLSVLSSSVSMINPDIPEAHRVKGWYDTVGHNADYNEFRSEGGQGAGGSGYSTNWKTFAEIKGQPITGDQAVYFTTKATIIHLKKENCMYQACPSADCNKKVIDQSNGFFRCEKCNKEYPNYKWRLILSANLADFSESQWVTCFQDTAETLLGKTGDELGQLKDQDENGFDRVFTEATFKQYTFKMRAKMESYNDEARLKTICVSASVLNFPEYNKKLINDIDALLAG